ncbi:hypothetical protein ATO12_09415 [Aquimarina atlantica]|uniref:CHAT domain-containing protein n=1 Tax=Aquimarina atlantica TaxID=1317122 RepID=A0A023BY10_9FLAO|nr:CHAT domain-containing tetratricopeptide repeat protein [Aquimarina atlantica]EZH74941.1 hypothetical protein ATO12_09415 [Aquimarina atlantica]
MKKLASIFLTSFFSIILSMLLLHTTQAQVTNDTLLAAQYYKKADSLLIEAKYKNSIESYKKSLILYQKDKLWEKVASCYNKISHIQKLASNFKESFKNANTALEICDQYLPKDTREKAHAYDNIGHYYEQSVSDFKTASENFHKALKIRNIIFPKNHEDIALSYDKIGVLHHRQGLIAKALEYYKKTLKIRLNIFGENHIITSKSYDRIGMIYEGQGKYQEAISNHTKVLEINTQTYGKNHIKTSGVHYSLGNIYIYIAKYEKAEFHLKKALKIRMNSNIENRENLAHLYYTLGMLYKDIGKYDLSKSYYQKALALYIELFDNKSIHVANTYFSLGLLFKKIGDYDIAMDYLTKSLNTYLEKKKNHPNLGKIYNSIGTTLIDKGAYEKALYYFKKSLDIAISIMGEDHYQTATAYINIAIVYTLKADYKRAFDYYNKSLNIEIKNRGNDHPKIAKLYSNIADVFTIEKQYEKALQYYENALNIYQNTYTNDHPEIAESLDKIGSLKQEMGLFDEAFYYFRKSLKIKERLYDKNNRYIAESYNKIAHTYFESGVYQNALDHYTKAQKANSKNKTQYPNNRNSFNDYIGVDVLLTTLNGKAETYTNLYLKNNDIKDLKNAIQTYEQVDLVMYNIRQSLATYQDKVHFGKQAKEIYQNAIAAHLLLYTSQKDEQLLEKALYYAEKSKANTLKELLNDVNAKNFGVLPDDLVILEKKLRTNRSFYQSKIIEEQSEKEIDTSKVTYYENKLFDINRTQDSLTLVLEKNYPKYHQLKYKNDIVSVSDIQQQLDDTTTLLEFFTGDSITYAFTISKYDISVQELSTPKLTEQVEAFRKSIIAKNTGAYKQQAYALYNTLITPVNDKLTGDQLIIIPDGPLWHLNFELVLTQKDDSNNPALLSYLLKKYAVTYANSANLLFTTFKSDLTTEPLQECLAFSFSDSTQTTEMHTMSMATLRDAGDDLPGTRKEIKAISDIIDGQYYFGSQAIEANFKSNAGQYNILHLALHGEVDNERPENSKLYFTRSKDTIEDNLLYSHELFALDIPAELTVLSACNTGSGKIAKGEGIMSLGTAFQYAGTKSLLLTSWEVSDQTTPGLMKYFYTNLKAGMHKGKALQQAKLQYLSTANINRTDPFYWGGFYLVGDTTAMQFNNNTQLYWVLGLGAVAVILLVVFLYMRRIKNA